MRRRLSHSPTFRKLTLLFFCCSFSFHACCQIMSLDANTRSEYQYLNYTIEAETFNNNRKYSRVWFGRDSSRPHSINRKIKISDTNKEYCDQHTVYIKENTRDILSPLKVSTLKSLTGNKILRRIRNNLRYCLRV